MSSYESSKEGSELLKTFYIYLSKQIAMVYEHFISFSINLLFCYSVIIFLLSSHERGKYR